MSYSSINYFDGMNWGGVPCTGDPDLVSANVPDSVRNAATPCALDRWGGVQDEDRYHHLCEATDAFNSLVAWRRGEAKGQRASKEKRATDNMRRGLAAEFLSGRRFIIEVSLSKLW